MELLELNKKHSFNIPKQWLSDFTIVKSGSLYAIIFENPNFDAYNTLSYIIGREHYISISNLLISSTYKNIIHLKTHKDATILCRIIKDKLDKRFYIFENDIFEKGKGVVFRRGVQIQEETIKKLVKFNNERA